MTKTKIRADVVVGIPTNEGMLHQSMYGAYERMINFTSKKGFTIARSLTNNKNLPLAYTKMVETAISAGAKYVLFMSPEIVVPEDALFKLMERKVPVVSGLYVLPERPFYPEAYISLKDKPLEHFMEVASEGIHEVSYTGLGLCLVETKVFEELKQPWFVITPDKLESEYFFDKASTLGFKANLDASVKCGRLGMDYYTVNDSLYKKEPTTDEVVG